MDKLFGDLIEFVFLLVAFFILFLGHMKKKPARKDEEEEQKHAAASGPSAEAPLIASKAKAAGSRLGAPLPGSAPLCQVSSPMAAERKPRSARASVAKGRNMILSYEIFSPPLCMRGSRR